ncbi:MAG: hypothetical protein M1836_001685 [Candelina mexicana]|nr:MAG: hypothetical protein M1836_001685 [Candelina mexicana]
MSSVPGALWSPMVKGRRSSMYLILNEVESREVLPKGHLVISGLANIHKNELKVEDIDQGEHNDHVDDRGDDDSGAVSGHAVDQSTEWEFIR